MPTGQADDDKGKNEQWELWWTAKPLPTFRQTAAVQECRLTCQIF